MAYFKAIYQHSNQRTEKTMKITSGSGDWNREPYGYEAGSYPL